MQRASGTAGERADRVGGAIPLEEVGPEERLPPAARAWLDPRQPLPDGVLLLPLRPAGPLFGPLAAGLLLGVGAGALGALLSRELQQGRIAGALTGAILVALLVLAAFAFARRGLRALGARLGGGRRARHGLLLGALGGEPVLVARLRQGEAVLLRRARLIDVVVEQPRGAKAPLIGLRFGPDAADARTLLLEGVPEGGLDAALATLRAWSARTAVG
jgi:hypothetical protein